MPWKSSFTSSASSSEMQPQRGSPHADWCPQGDREPRVDRQLSSPPFDATYAGSPWNDCGPTIELMKTSRPRPRADATRDLEPEPAGGAGDQGDAPGQGEALEPRGRVGACH